MAASCRFAFAVHVLTVLALKEAGVTSSLLAESVNTNPVVIRRLLCLLQQAGLVCTQKGAGHGSRLCRPASEITLDQIYRAIEPGLSFSPHPHQPNQGCLVGRKIEEVLSEVCAAAQSALEDALSRRTLADVVTSVAQESQSEPKSRHLPQTA